MKRPKIDTGILLLLAAVVLLLLGVWWRWVVVLSYDGPQTKDAFDVYAVSLFAYSDLSSLYFRDGLASVPLPYFDYQFEYPVGTGLFVYAINAATSTLPGYFLLSSLVLAVCGITVAGLVERFPRGRLASFALSPALALYVNLNWDMLGILLMVVALLFFWRQRYAWAAVALAAAVWTKFFPLMFLPLLAARCWTDVGRRETLSFVGVFALTSMVINAPVLLLTPEGWWHFFAFNSSRGGELNLYTLLIGVEWLSPEEMNRVGTLLLLWGLTVLLMIQRRSPYSTWLPSCCALLAWFFFLNKAYSPQYDLWIVALLALIGAPLALAMAWSVADLLYFAAHFLVPAISLDWYGTTEAQGWFAENALQLATVLRGGMLLVVVGWCVHRMIVERPRGSPVAVTRAPGSACP